MYIIAIYVFNNTTRLKDREILMKFYISTKNEIYSISILYLCIITNYCDNEFDELLLLHIRMLYIVFINCFSQSNVYKDNIKYLNLSMKIIFFLFQLDDTQLLINKT